MTRFNPSYMNGFAPRDFQSEYPELWRGCVGAWCPMLGPTGEAIRDWSGFGRHATVVNATLSSAWKLYKGAGYCLETNGTNSYITAAVSAVSFNSLSLAYWINTPDVNSTPPADGLVSWADALSSGTPMFLHSGNSRILIDNAYNTTLQYLTANEWYHIAVSRRGRLWDVYQNGVWKFQVDDGGAAQYQNVATTLFFGNGFSGYGQARFDDMRAYNRPLSANEISILSQRRGIAYEPLPVRPAALQPMRPCAKAYVGGSWQQVPVKAYVSGSWKNIEPRVYVGGVWY